MTTTPFRLGPNQCCCPQCWEFRDDFNRAPGTDIGANWHEEEGDWCIEGNILEGWLAEVYDAAGGTADSVVICTQPVPFHSAGEMSIAVAIKEASTGDKDYIYPCCKDIHTVGPVKVEFWCTEAPSQWTVTISVGGVSKATRDYIADVDESKGWPEVIAHVCADDHDEPEVFMIKAWITSIPVYEELWIDGNDAGNGRYVGLGHNNTETGVNFDDFSVGELRLIDNTMCIDCWCTCLGHAVDKTLHATGWTDPDFAIANDGNRMDCMNDKTWDMDWAWAVGVGGWEGEITVTGYDPNPPYAYGHDYTFHLALSCQHLDDNDPTWPGKNFSLSFDAPLGVCVPGTGAGPYIPIQEWSKCDPLELWFGPFDMSFPGNLACGICYPIYDEEAPTEGQWYIIITD